MQNNGRREQNHVIYSSHAHGNTAIPVMGWAGLVDGLGKVSTTGTSICFLFHFGVALLISVPFPLLPQSLVYLPPNRNSKILVAGVCSLQ